MKKLLLSALILSVCPPLLRAQTLIWDSNPSLVGAQDGSGDWAGLTNWRSGTSNTFWGGGGAKIAVFGSGSGSAGTVTLATGYTFGGLTFNAAGSGGYVLTGGSLTPVVPLGASAATITTNANATVRSVLARPSSVSSIVKLSKAGAGTLDLQAGTNGQRNTFSGRLTIDAGTMMVGVGPNVFSANSGITPDLVINSGGTLRLGQAEVIPSGITVGSGTAAMIPALTVNAGGTFDLNGFNETVGGLIGTGTIALTGGARLTVDSANGLNASAFSGVISGTGSFELRSGLLTTPGQSRLVVGQRSTYTGATIIGENDAGTPSLIVLGGLANGGVPSALGASSSAPENLQFNKGNLSYRGGSISVDRGALFVRSGTIDVRTSTTNLTLTGSLIGEAGADINVRPLELIGAGTLTLAGTSNNAGNTAIVTSGTLALAKASSASVHAIDAAGEGLRVSPLRVVRLEGTGDDQLSGTTDVTLDGILEMNGRSEGFDALSGSGSIRNSAPGTASTLSLGEADGNSTFAGAIVSTASAPIGLVKTGAGAIVLNGANSYAGPTTVNAGTLLLRTAPFDPAAATTVTVNSGGTLAGDGVYGPLTVRAGGTLAPGLRAVPGSSATMTAHGLTFGPGETAVHLDFGTQGPLNAKVSDEIISNGDLAFDGLTQITPRAGSDGIAPGVHTILRYTGALRGDESRLAIANPSHFRQTFAFSPTSSTPGKVEMVVSGVAADLVWKGGAGANAWEVGGVNHWTNRGVADRFLQTDRVTFDEAGAEGANVVLTGELNPTSVVVNNSVTPYVFTGAGSLVGGMALAKSGAGTLTITNPNLFTGGTLVGGGTLRLDHPHALGPGLVTVSGSGALDLNSFSQRGKDNTFSIFGPGPTGEGALINNGAMALVDAESVGNLTFAGDVTIGGSARWDVPATAMASVPRFALTKAGTNEIRWRAPAAIPLGDLVIKGGRFVAQLSNNLGDPAFPAVVEAGAELSTTVPQNKPVILRGGTLSVENSMVWNGTVTLEEAGTSNKFRTAGTSSSTWMTLAGKLTGPGGFVKLGPGTLELSSASNDYAGDTVVSAGTLSLQGGAKLPATTRLTLEGTLQLESNPQTVAGLSGTGSLIGDTGAVLTVNQAFDSTFTGRVGQLIKNGPGTLTLANASGFGGASLDVNGGTVVLALVSATGQSAVSEKLTINRGSTVRLVATGSQQIDFGTPVTVSAGGVLDLGGSNEGIGNLVGGGLITNAGASPATLQLVGGAFSYSSDISDFSGTIQDGVSAVSLNVTGGTYVFSGVNTYTGQTTVAGGTLVVNGRAASTRIVLSRSTAGTPTFLAGVGQVGDVHVGDPSAFTDAQITPGLNTARGSIGTLSVASYASKVPPNAARGNPVRFDFSRSTTAGAGVNDLVAVAGDLSFTGSTGIGVNPVDGVLAAGDYTLFTYGGLLNQNSASFALLGLPQDTRQSFVIDPAGTPGAVLLRVAGDAATLRWIGDGDPATTTDRWDVKQTASWSGGEKFFNLDSVVFDDASAMSSPVVNVGSGVSLGNATIENSVGHDYTFQGTGFTGSGTLLKKGTGTLNLETSYSGRMVISKGTVVMKRGGEYSSPSGLVLGDAETGGSNVTLLRAGASEGLRSPIVVSSNGTGPVTIGAAETAAGTYYQFFGPITLERPTTLQHSGAGAYAGFHNIAGNVGTLTLTGGARIVIGGTNTFAGNVVLAGAGTTLDSGSNKLPDASAVELGAGTSWQLDGDLIGGLSGTGNITGSKLSVGAGGANGSFGGKLTGSLHFTKVGAGTQTLSGANTHIGLTEVSGGTLLINGSLPGGSTTQVNSGATLGGSGTLAKLVLLSGGHLAPGEGIGSLSAASLIWSGGGVLDFDLGPEHSSDRLSLGVGALTKGATTPFVFNFQGSGENDSAYTLITFGSTSFQASDFAFTNLAPGLNGSFQVEANRVRFLTVPEPASVSFLVLGGGLLGGLRRWRRKY